MKKNLNLPYALLMGIMVLTSCEKELVIDGANEVNSTEQQPVTIFTRGTGNDAKISYPVHLYVMNADGLCVEKETMTEGNTLSLSLPSATYAVYALAGATEWVYDLPTVATARPDYTVALKDNATHADLMSASNTLVVSKDGENGLTLNLQRKVMMIQSITIKEVPSTTETVTVSISPIYKNLLLNGNYTSETAPITLTLVKQGDGTTWKNASEVYSLPASESAKLTVKMTTANDSKSYSYSCPTSLEANHEVNITGTYTENQSLQISGTVNGAQWGTPTDITFSFDESNVDTGGDVQNETAPAIETWYKKCYVLTTVDDGDYVNVVLLHKDAQHIDCEHMTIAEIDAAVSTALPGFDIDGISGWRLPTKSEAGALVLSSFNAGVESAGGTVMGSSDIHLGRDDDGYFGFSSNSANYSSASVTLLRPVTTVRFRKE